MTLHLHDILLVLGILITAGALWAMSWQAGMVGVGLCLIVASWFVCGIWQRRQQKRRKP